MEMDVALSPDELSAHGIVVIERPPPPAGAAAKQSEAADAAEPVLPAFPFKGLDWFGGKKEDATPKATGEKGADKGNKGKIDKKASPEELPEPDKGLKK
jgi:hypothetical protein